MSRQYGEPGLTYPSPDDSYVLGLCTGSLAAAAISSCSTLSELLPAAVQTVQVAFRLGMCVVRMRDRIEAPSTDFTREWSIMLSDMAPKLAETAISDFCKANVSGPFLEYYMIPKNHPSFEIDYEAECANWRIFRSCQGACSHG